MAQDRRKVWAVKGMSELLDKANTILRNTWDDRRLPSLPGKIFLACGQWAVTQGCQAVGIFYYQFVYFFH